MAALISNQKLDYVYCDLILHSPNQSWTRSAEATAGGPPLARSFGNQWTICFGRCSTHGENLARATDYVNYSGIELSSCRRTSSATTRDDSRGLEEGEKEREGVRYVVPLRRTEAYIRVSTNSVTRR